MPQLKEHQNKMIYQLAQQEFLVAELYTVMAERFPEQQEHWLALSAEELEHASWIEYLFKKTEEGLLRFDEQRATTYTMDSFLAYLHKTIILIKEQKPDMTRALSLVRDIERAILEKKMFDHFRPLNDEMRNVLEDLKEKMREHCDRIEKKTAPAPEK